MTVPGKGGRPSILSEDLIDTICRRMVDERKSATAICEDMGIPASTFFTWTQESWVFEKYARARDMLADAWFDECIEIADDGRNDWVEKRNAEGEVTGWTLNGEHVQRSKLRADTRRWMVSKMAPKRYGERATHVHEGGDMPVRVIRDVIV